jgi:DNA-binding response OmpR family regulator
VSVNDKKTIIIVEDEPLLGTLLKQRIEREGFATELFSDGNEALRYLAQNDAALVLLDIIMPKMSGFEFLETLRKGTGYHIPPVVFMSNLGQEVDIKRGEELGAAGYLVKAKASLDEIVQSLPSFFRG